MNKTKWQSIKKNLPKNWAQQVSESLTNKGFIVTPGQVSDIKGGKVKDPGKITLVLQEIKLLNQKELKKRKALKNIL